MGEEGKTAKKQAVYTFPKRAHTVYDNIKNYFLKKKCQILRYYKSTVDKSMVLCIWKNKNRKTEKKQ